MADTKRKKAIKKVSNKIKNWELLAFINEELNKQDETINSESNSMLLELHSRYEAAIGEKIIDTVKTKQAITHEIFERFRDIVEKN